MANFCGKCGAAIADGAQFCGVCGTPVAAGTPAPVANYTQPYAPPVGVPLPPRTNSSAVKIILIVVGVFVGLGILVTCILTFTFWRVTRGIHVNNHGDKVTVETPAGTISTDQSESYSTDELGVEVYPGATSGHGSMKMNLGEGSMVTGVFTTSDSKEKVLDFYKGKYGNAVATIDTPEAAILTLKKSDTDSVMITISSKSSENDGRTQIAIVHTKKS